jgi:hypothetical protein
MFQEGSLGAATACAYRYCLQHADAFAGSGSPDAAIVHSVHAG